MELICKFCKHQWDYTGSMKMQATCPDCMRRIKIATSRVEEEKK